jgi:N-methylhydantoinase B
MNKLSKLVNQDPITIEIIQNSLGAIADEMFVAMARTAMSSVIYEVLDFGVAITDAVGDLATSGAGIPSFIGMLDPGVKAIIAKFGPKDQIHPGDVFITNDPYNGGVSHMNDVVLLMPVHYEGELIAWTANKGHWVDIGGMSPGSIDPNATEIFQEGLMLPEVKLFDRGEPVEAVFDIIKANGRLPEQTMGDMWAGIAALRVGKRRLTELMDKYGRETVKYAIRAYLDYGEAVSRRAIKALPKGTYEAEDLLDDGRRLQVAVTVTEDEFIVDLRGNPPQDPGAYNASYFATMVSAQIIFRGITCPDTRANAGSFRPLKLICDDGGLFNAKKPAAIGLYYENKIRSADLIWKAMAPHIPDRITAGHFCSICATIIGGINSRTGKSHSFIEPEPGGWGAGAGKDGENAQFSSSHGETYNCPVEVNEARNGILVDSYRLNDEPGGEGEFRGGKGLMIDYRILDDTGWVTAAYTRTRIAPWGLHGGRDGSCNYLKVKRSDGREETYASVSNAKLGKDDVVCIVTANGGGYGDPRKRTKQKIMDDIRNDYLTLDQAQKIYGFKPKDEEKKGG